jgi:hypothetical protein
VASIVPSSNGGWTRLPWDSPACPRRRAGSTTIRERGTLRGAESVPSAGGSLVARYSTSCPRVSNPPYRKRAEYGLLVGYTGLGVVEILNGSRLDQVDYWYGNAEEAGYSNYLTGVGVKVG